MRATPQGRAVTFVPGMFEKHGTLAMSVGLFRPRILVDPRTWGEHRVLQSFIRLHEGAHILLGHTRLLSVAKGLSVVMFFSLGLIAAAFTQSVPAMLVVGYALAWLEAKHGTTTLWLRALCEVEADEVALSTMKPHEFATAVKTMEMVKPKMRGWRRYEDARLNGADWQARLARVGVSVPDVRTAVPHSPVPAQVGHRDRALPRV